MGGGDKVTDEDRSDGVVTVNDIYIGGTDSITLREG